MPETIKTCIEEMDDKAKGGMLSYIWLFQFLRKLLDILMRMETRLEALEKRHEKR
jgi:hypothetical protein